jgi:REP element-mobilizing transposase RayT
MSYTRLRYHIVTGTHNREPLITPPVEEVLYPALRVKADDADGRVLRVGGIADHVHLVAALRPTVSVSGFMRVVKTGSCAAVREQFGRAAFRWQRGYAAFTVAPHDMRRVLDYVARQKERHAADRVWRAYERTGTSE